MKRILFDGTSMQSSHHAKYHGGGEYAKIIFKEAIIRGYKFDIALNSNLFIEQFILDLINNNNLKIIYINSKSDLYNKINEGNYDIFYSALPYQYFDYISSAEFIGVIHGLRQIEIIWDKYKHLYYSSKIKRFIGWCISHMPMVQNYIYNKRENNISRLLRLPNAKFITVSNHTKYALITFFPFLQSNNIKVFYSPFDDLTNFKPIKNTNNYPYFLIVSGNRFEKNSYRAIKALDSLFSDGLLKDYKVIITGANNLPFSSKIKNKNKFELLSYVETHELYNLYANAFCFIYPSLNEGFGYPPIVSMQFGVPVICSAVTSIPEVCDKAAIYYNPYSIEELKNRILQISLDNEIYKKMITRGKERVKELLTQQEKSMSSYINYIFK